MARRTRKAKKRRRSGSRPRARTKTRTKAGTKLARKRPAPQKRHPAKVRNSPQRLRKLRANPRAEAAVLEMNRGRSLTAAVTIAHNHPLCI